MSRKLLLSLLIIATFLAGCSHHETKRDVASSFKDRGAEYLYDPGPAKEWNDLIAETPNYRAFGDAVIGGFGEKFRWMFGPMWYRGRINGKSGQCEKANGCVKVFIIGQEGAQDENVSNRSFTGSTGTKVQKFLHYLGLEKNYLFMNTFVYTIAGQYSLFDDDAKNEKKIKENDRLLWLAQNSDSIVVEHRHKMFDKVLEDNKGDLALVIGVGTAGKDSAVTWAKKHGVACTDSKISSSFCEGAKGSPLAGVRFIGVPHPGGASAKNGGLDALERLTKTFKSKMTMVSEWLTDGKWHYKPDFDAPSADGYRYGNAKLYHGDFAFGTNWRMGDDGTSSNRRGSDTIQIFSENGCYNNVGRNSDGSCDENKTHNVMYEDPTDETKGLLAKTYLGNSKLKEMEEGDLPFESPKGSKRHDFDMGPDGAIPNQFGHSERLLNFYNVVKDTFAGKYISHPSFGHTGIYRGTFKKPEVLILADQESHDDMFTGRALSGTLGQKLQTYLNNSGKKSYLILRTLPVDTLDMNSSEVRKMALNKKVVEARAAIMAEVGNAEVLTLGDIAKEVASAHGLQAQAIDAEVSKLALSNISRSDLPAHTRWWMGTSGTRSSRGSDSKGPNGDYYKVYAPGWATSWKEDASRVKDQTLQAEFDSFKKMPKGL
jgi:hypothetical protein